MDPVPIEPTRRLARVSALLAIVLLGLLLTSATPAHATLLQVGVYADEARTIDCVDGPLGGSFEQTVWAWVPRDRGLIYVTLRFDFPDGLDRSARPVFHESIDDLIVTDYADGTTEWNMILDGSCPGGWVQLFRQRCVIESTQRMRIGIRGQHSMIRACDFVLEDVVVVSELEVNDPACETVPRASEQWGALKGRFAP